MSLIPSSFLQGTSFSFEDAMKRFGISATAEKIADWLYETEPKFRQLVDTLFSLVDSREIPEEWLSFLAVLINKRLTFRDLRRWWELLREHPELMIPFEKREVEDD